jgi:uncharacterized protein (TIGR03067 family)
MEFPMPRLRRAFVLLVCLVSCNVRSDVPVTKELEKLQGTWRITSRGEREGDQEVYRDAEDKVTFMLSGEKYVMKEDDEVVERGRLVLDPTKNPKECNLVIEYGKDEGKTRLCIYELDGDTWRVRKALPGSPDRPRAMLGSITIYTRQKP